MVSQPGPKGTRNSPASNTSPHAPGMKSGCEIPSS
jgi:hypothetical protein